MRCFFSTRVCFLRLLCSEVCEFASIIMWHAALLAPLLSADLFDVLVNVPELLLSRAEVDVIPPRLNIYFLP